MIRGGQLIKYARKARGMTQVFVANAHGADVSTISRWERLIMPISYDDLIWIVEDVFKMTLEQAKEIAINENII